LCIYGTNLKKEIIEKEINSKEEEVNRVRKGRFEGINYLSKDKRRVRLKGSTSRGPIISSDLNYLLKIIKKLKLYFLTLFPLENS